MAKKPRPDESALALIEYPSRFPLKVFGDNSQQFETVVFELVRARCPAADTIELSKRDSKNGKYVSLTLTFTVYSQRQLEEIYADLYHSEHVLMSL